MASWVRMTATLASKPREASIMVSVSRTGSTLLVSAMVRPASEISAESLVGVLVSGRTEPGEVSRVTEATCTPWPSSAVARLTRWAW